MEFTANEFQSATTHRDRYFLYRVFVDPQEDGVFEIGILADPVNSTAIRRITRFDLRGDQGTDWYRVSS